MCGRTAPTRSLMVVYDIKHKTQNQYHGIYEGAIDIFIRRIASSPSVTFDSSGRPKDVLPHITQQP